MKVGVNGLGSIPSLSECDPGLRPVEFNVLIAPEGIPEKTAGGIILPDAVKDGDQESAQRGLLVAVSDAAFTFDDRALASAPVVGDTVCYKKFAGVLVEGRDGRKYRLCKDQDISGVIEQPEFPDVNAKGLPIHYHEKTPEVAALVSLKEVTV